MDYFKLVEAGLRAWQQRLPVLRRPPRLVYVSFGQITQFRHPGPDVLATRVELLAL